jgi:hypothetical protein
MDQTSSRICPWCSAEVPDTSSACPKCGALVEGARVADFTTVLPPGGDLDMPTTELRWSAVEEPAVEAEPGAEEAPLQEPVVEPSTDEEDLPAGDRLAIVPVEEPPVEEPPVEEPPVEEPPVEEPPVEEPPVEEPPVEEQVTELMPEPPAQDAAVAPPAQDAAVAPPAQDAAVVPPAVSTELAPVADQPTPEPPVPSFEPPQPPVVAEAGTPEEPRRSVETGPAVDAPPWEDPELEARLAAWLEQNPDKA